MRTRPKVRVVVIGAGPAGVGAAFALTARGDSGVTVLEASSRVGGNAGSIDVGGMRCDIGSHRLHPACAPEVKRDIGVLLGDDLVWRRRHGRIRLMDTWVRFPLRPDDLLRALPPRTSLRFARDLFSPRDRRAVNGEPKSFADELARRFGPMLSGEFYAPYAEKIWGLPADEISVVQAEKRVSARSMREIAGKAVRSVAGAKPVFGYPEHGFGEIAERYAAAAADRGARLVLGYDGRVEAIETDGSERNIRTISGAKYRADVVLSTMPITALARAVRPAAPDAVREAAARLRFRSMLLVYLVLPVDRFSEWDAHYFPGREVAITRLSEPKNYRGGGAPHDRTVICAELPCDTSDPVWVTDAARLGARVADDLDACGLGLPAAPVDVHVERIAAAYPVYPVGFESDFETLDTWASGLERVVTLGRQGLFVHDNSHHAYEMGYEAAACVTRTGEFDADRWARARRRFAENTVED